MQVVELTPRVKAYIGFSRGDLSSFARSHGISLSYASLIRSGKRQPPDWMLQDMGIIRRVRRGSSGEEKIEYLLGDAVLV